MNRPLPASRAAVPSDTVVDSLGMVCHYNYRNPGNAWEHDVAVTDQLIELGIRHVRVHWSEGYVAKIIRNACLRLANSTAHTKTMLRVLDNDDTQTLAEQKTRIQTMLDEIKTTWLPGAPNPSDVRSVISGFEGVNEPDHVLGKDANGNPIWVGNTHRAQQAIWDVVKGTPQPNHVNDTDVVGPSIVNMPPGVEANFLAVGNLSQWTTRACMHTYPQGLPSFGIDADMAAAAPAYPDKEPFTVSEGGYHDDMSYTGRGDPQPADVVNAYGPRFLFEHVTRGNRIFWYEMLDGAPDLPGYDNKTDAYGFIEVPAAAGQPLNWQHKPIFDTMKRLLAIYNDYGTTFTPKPLAVTVNSTDDPDVKSHLSQRSDGKWLLALWRDKLLYDTDTGQPITVPPANVKLTLATAAPVKALAPSKDDTWTDRGTTSSVVIKVDGHLKVVQIG